MSDLVSDMTNLVAVVLPVHTDSCLHPVNMSRPALWYLGTIPILLPRGEVGTKDVKYTTVTLRVDEDESRFDL